MKLETKFHLKEEKKVKIKKKKPLTQFKIVFWADSINLFILNSQKKVKKEN